MITVRRVSRMPSEDFHKHLELRHKKAFLSIYTQGLIPVLAAYHRRLHNGGLVKDHDHKDLEDPHA